MAHTVDLTFLRDGRGAVPNCTMGHQFLLSFSPRQQHCRTNLPSSLCFFPAAVIDGHDRKEVGKRAEQFATVHYINTYLKKNSMREQTSYFKSTFTL
jgi:hypothetical protein